MPINVSDNSDQNLKNRSFGEKMGRLWARSEVPVFILLPGMAVIYGWWIRIEADWSSESGAAYILGIVGGSLMLSQLLYLMRKNFRWRSKFRLSRELKQRARQEQLSKIEIRKTLIAYIRGLRKVVEYMMYGKSIFPLACFAHYSVRCVGSFRSVSYRSGPFVLSK